MSRHQSNLSLQFWKNRDTKQTYERHPRVVKIIRRRTDDYKQRAGLLPPPFGTGSRAVPWKRPRKRKDSWSVFSDEWKKHIPWNRSIPSWKMVPLKWPHPISLLIGSWGNQQPIWPSSKPRLWRPYKVMSNLLPNQVQKRNLDMQVGWWNYVHVEVSDRCTTSPRNGKTARKGQYHKSFLSRIMKWNAETLNSLGGKKEP